jgi:hypothetical protein
VPPCAARGALGAVLVYQLTLIYCVEHHQNFRVGLNVFIKATRLGSQKL